MITQNHIPKKEESYMNKIYKVIWSKAKNCYIVVSELAKRVSRSASPARASKACLAAILAATALTVGTIGMDTAQAATVYGESDYEHYAAFIADSLPSELEGHYTYREIPVTDNAGNPVYNNGVAVTRGYYVLNGYDVILRTEEQVVDSDEPTYENVIAEVFVKNESEIPTVLKERTLISAQSIVSPIVAGADNNKVKTVLGASLNSINMSTYVAAANGGPLADKSWDYIIEDTNSKWVNLKGTDQIVAATYNQTEDRFYYTTTDTKGNTVHHAVDNNENVYYLTDTKGTPSTYDDVTSPYVFLRSDGSLYTGTVRGLHNEILMTAVKNEGENKVLYTYWGGKLNDDQTLVSKSDITVGDLNKAFRTFEANDKNLAQADITNIKLTQQTNGGTLGMIRNNDASVLGEVTISSTGGTDGQDVKVQFSNQGIKLDANGDYISDPDNVTTFTVDAGSKVVANGGGTGDKLSTISVNGTTYTIVDTDTNNYVTSGSVSYDGNGNGTITLDRQDLADVTISGLKDTTLVAGDAGVDITTAGSSGSNDDIPLGRDLVISDTADNTVTLVDVARNSDITTGVTVSSSNNSAKVQFNRNSGKNAYGMNFVGGNNVTIGTNENGDITFSATDTNTVTSLTAGNNVTVTGGEVDENGNKTYTINATDTNNYVTSGNVTYGTNGAGTLTLTQEGINEAVSIQGLQNTYTTGVTVDKANNSVTFVRNDDTSYSVNFTAGGGANNGTAYEDTFVQIGDTNGIKLSTGSKVVGTGVATPDGNAQALSGLTINGEQFLVPTITANTGSDTEAPYLTSIELNGQTYNILSEGAAKDLTVKAGTYTVSDGKVTMDTIDSLTGNGTEDKIIIDDVASASKLTEVAGKVETNTTNITKNATNITNLTETVNKGWNLKVNDGEAQNVALGDTVTLLNGDNMVVTSGANGITFATKKDVAFDTVSVTDTVTVGNIAIDKANGIGMSGMKITNLAAGVDDNDAVNVSQLNQKVTELTTNINNSKTVVEAGNNVTISSETDQTTGQVTYTIDGKKTTVSTDDTNLTITAGTEVNGVTDYNVSLNESITLGNTAANQVMINGLTGTLKLGNTVVISTSGINMGGMSITNLLAGVNDTDAVNVSQLNDAVNTLTANDNHLVVNPNAEAGHYAVADDTVTLKVQGKDANGETVYTDVVIDDVASATDLSNLEKRVTTNTTDIDKIEKGYVSNVTTITNSKGESELTITTVNNGNESTTTFTDTRNDTFVGGEVANNEATVTLTDTKGKVLTATITNVAQADDLNALENRIDGLTDTTLKDGGLTFDAGNGDLSMTVTDTSGNSVTGKVNIDGYVSDKIDAEAADAKYNDDMSIGEAISKNATDIATNASNIATNKAAIEQNAKDITQNKSDIAQNKADIASNTSRIKTIEDTYVRDITQDGNTLTITQGDTTKEFTFTDTNTTNAKLENTWNDDDSVTLTLTDSADKQVSTTIKDVASAKELDKEVSDRQAADTALGERIDDEAKARQDADNALSDRINKEASDREKADTALGERIDKEVSDRIANDIVAGAIDREAGTVTLTKGDQTTITLDGNLCDSRLDKVTYDAEAGKLTFTVTDHYNQDQQTTLEVDDIASKTALEKEVTDRQTMDNAIINDYTQRTDALSGQINTLGHRMTKAVAGAAALAALHPLDFDPDDKLSFSAGVGNYGGSTAAAIGAFYRPNERVMFSIGGTVGNGEDMVNAGVSFALGKGGKVNASRVAMTHEINDLRQQVAYLSAVVAQMAAQSGYQFTDMKPFPDTAENHWAYEYVAKLAAEGIVEGYPSGNFDGDRTMTRYEFAAMLFHALEKGITLDTKIIDEFEPELGRLSVERIKGEQNQKEKIERVRVNDSGEDRDVYGGKITVGKNWP